MRQTWIVAALQLPLTLALSACYYQPPTQREAIEEQAARLETTASDMRATFESLAVRYEEDPFPTELTLAETLYREGGGHSVPAPVGALTLDELLTRIETLGVEIAMDSGQLTLTAIRTRSARLKLWSAAVVSTPYLQLLRSLRSATATHALNTLASELGKLECLGGDEETYRADPALALARCDARRELSRTHDAGRTLDRLIHFARNDATLLGGAGEYADSRAALLRDRPDLGPDTKAFIQTYIDALDWMTYYDRVGDLADLATPVENLTPGLPNEDPTDLSTQTLWDQLNTLGPGTPSEARQTLLQNLEQARTALLDESYQKDTPLPGAANHHWQWYLEDLETLAQPFATQEQAIESAYANIAVLTSDADTEAAYEAFTEAHELLRERFDQLNATVKYATAFIRYQGTQAEEGLQTARARLSEAL